MTTLDGAWQWYVAVKEGMTRLTQLSKYWDELPWAADVPGVTQFARDNALRTLSADAMAGDAALVRTGLDDLAVLLLFSVFEAIVRDRIGEQVSPEIGQLKHPTLVKAGKDVLDAITQGSFFRLLEPYKSDAALVEQVNQVRRYRNWVARGRNADKRPDALVTPEAAYDRLTRFLAYLESVDTPSGGSE